jgi:hypothetical protein
MSKYGSLFREINMPNWPLKEIMEAIEALDLDISQDVIKKRWMYFGGAPRYLFEKDEETVVRAINNVRTALDSLEFVQDVVACFNGKADPEVVVHRLMHYDVKNMEGVFDHSLKMASKHIAYAVQEKLIHNLRVDQKVLMSWLRGSSKAAAFLGWIFEGYAHEKLQKGRDLHSRR